MCHGKPLQREEALERAIKRLHCTYEVEDELSQLVEEQYNSDTKTWMFRFQNAGCIVYIIADRCQGTEVGGASAGCLLRGRGSKKEACYK
jgi:hypothetical protein